jgi:hypothetical protein
VTYCFEVENTGDTHLNNISVTDNSIGVGETSMDYVQGAFPLPPGGKLLYVYRARAQGALVNIAHTSASATTPLGIRITGLPNPQAIDQATLQIAP